MLKVSFSKNKLESLFSEKVLPWLVLQCDPIVVEHDMTQGLYIYGAGELGALALEYCESCNIPVLGVLDRSRTGIFCSKAGRDYAIDSPDITEEVIDKSAPVAVAIATLPFEPIRDQLNASGWKCVFPFYNLAADSCAGHPLRNGWRLGAVSDVEKNEVEWICNRWNDEVSWRHYEAFIAWHRDNSELNLDSCPIEPDQRYAIPELLRRLASRRQQFVDVGSHRGESVQRLNKAGIYFDEYILLEPDALSREYLISHQVDFLPKGSRASIRSDVVGETNCIAPYQDGLGYCSQLWSEATDKRQVVPLDSLNLRPDFLKVHTEGTELSVLRGAMNTVLHSRPCLAFSVYHRREGFYKDIAEAMRMFPGYRWFFRLHSHQGTGAFVYAIPNSI